jgi:hypothetical protein
MTRLSSDPIVKDNLATRFRMLTGRDPSPQLARFRARRGRLLLSLPLAARRHAARVIAR